MVVEQEKVVIKAEDPRDYKAKHEAQGASAEVHIFTAEVPPDGFYKDKIKSLLEENTRLRNELAKKEKELDQINHLIEVTEKNNEGARAARELEVSRELAAKNQRIEKLEKALVEATIR